MQASIQQKQAYLRIEILQSGYDPEDFIQYMNSTSTIQSPSIQVLTWAELQRIVTGYKQQVKRRNTIAEEQKVKNQIQLIKNLDLEVPKNTEKLNVEEKKVKIQYDRFGTSDYQFKGTVPCIQADKIIKEERIQITVPQMETKQVQGYIFGIGGKTQYYYHIKSNLIKGTVKRLSQDFDWLNTTILKLYPFILIPQLEPVRKDIKDPYIKRQKQIEQYLQHLAQKKALVNSYLFVDFLTISSEKMEKLKKSYDSMGFAKGVSLFKTEQGLVQIQLSNRTRQVYSDSKQFCKKTATLHDSLTQAFTKMTQSYKTAIADTYLVVDLFAELHDAFIQIGNKFPLLKKSQYNETLVNLNNLFLGIGDNIKSITDTIQKHTKDYFRFYNTLDRNIAKLQKQVKDSQAQYLQFKTNLQRKKQRVISDPSKWDIGNRQIDTKKLSKQQLMKLILPKQVLAECQLKFWYGFQLKNYQNQLYSYLNFVNNRYRKVFKLMAVQLLADDKLYLETITSFISQNRKFHQNPSSMQQWDPEKLI